MADTVVTLRWLGEGLKFESEGSGGITVPIDGDGEVGTRPMELLLIGLAGCMGIDIVDIVHKMRVELEGLDVRVEGDRAPEPPRRYTRIRLAYEARGVAEEDLPKLQRAVDLSEEKYCSVLHTLRQDIELETEIRLS